MNQKQREAINLMLEDLYTVHTNIRHQAKVLECEPELDELRNDIVNYLKSYK